MVKKVKKEVDEWLNEVDYEFIGYMPTTEALMFVNFIKEVNNGAEENETPLVHLKMMDNVFNGERRCAVLCHRGLGKTTLFAEYLILFIAAFGYFPGFGKTNLMLYITDSIENGVKNLRRNVEYRYQESEFLQQLIPNKKVGVGTEGTGFVGLEDYESQVAAGRKFTDIRLEFVNNKGHRTIVKGYGAKALSLDTPLFTINGTTTIGECVVGQKIFGPDGKLARITAKSEVFNKPMYKLELEDGRFLKVSEDHINSVVVNETPNSIANWVEKDMTTLELLEHGWLHSKKGNINHKGISNKCTVKIKNTAPMEYPEVDLDIDPYTLGLILGDGSIKRNASGIVVTGNKQDTDFYRKHIPYALGDDYLDKRTESVVTFSIKGINQQIRDLGLAVHGKYKFIPVKYLRASVQQRCELLRGLLDTDGTISENGRIVFVSASYDLVQNTASLVRSLGGKAHFSKLTNVYKIEIWLGVSPFKLPRKANKFVSTRRHWNMVNVIDIKKIEDEPSQCIAIDNEDHQFLAGEYFRTHNTGVRGAKEMGQRPTVALLDDLVSDEDARSDTVIDTIENTVYKAVSKALHPKKQKMVWLGTPFNKKDPLYKAVESGAWVVSCYPVCERFPVKEEDFKGSWEDRFDYEYVRAEYEEAMAVGKPENFFQELMLRIMSEEDKLIQTNDVEWYKKSEVMKKRDRFNFYITTDFATSEKKKSDFSVISVWAYTNNGTWLLVDGVCKKQLMDKNINDLFRLAAIYKPLGVGIEVSGQQGGFVSWIKQEMITRNVYFMLTSENNSGAEGIKPVTDKITRFNQVLPLFKQKKIWFPEEMKDTDYMIECMEELKNVTKGGFKSKHDDVCDTISMLSVMNPYAPSEELTDQFKDESGYWAESYDNEDRTTGSTVF